jgi:hypothetical protein
MKTSLHKLISGSLLILTAWLPLHGQSDWGITDSIPLDAIIVDLIKDPTRPYLYALNRTDSKVLFIDLELKTISELYVGKLPTSLALNASNDKLYVANAGTGSGTSGGYQIAVVDIATKTKSHHFLTNYQPINLVIGNNDRLYYNNGAWDFGNTHSTSGSTGVINLNTEAELGGIGSYRIKSHMVMNDDKTKLYGQYTYTGNLGEMGVFDIETDTIFKLDDHPYSPYPYGWDYNNLSISSNGNRLAYGYVLFNADNLLIQYGVFQELIYALNQDGAIAFGGDYIWDTSSFASTGEATALLNHNLDAKVMFYDSDEQALYAFSPNDYSVKVLTIATETEFPVDEDEDGLDIDQETAHGTDPTKWDTDDDGLDDGSEIANGLNPLVANAETAEMRALKSTLKRNAGEVDVFSPVIWAEYGKINITLQLEGSDDMESFAPIEEPVSFQIPMSDESQQQFYRIDIK